MFSTKFIDMAMIYNSKGQSTFFFRSKQLLSWSKKFPALYVTKKFTTALSQMSSTHPPTLFLQDPL